MTGLTNALRYHAQPVPGKIAIRTTKPCSTQTDLSLAYTPGVAEPCLKIADNPEDAYRYTSKGNLVAVVSNGTAVLGLGNIGALAGKPVMEGKGVLFKRFADIDVFDIEVASEDPAEVIRVCELLEPTFGGINLEDIRAPECFVIERALRERLSIPVFHDDQHGTAIISGAALLNALEITGKRIEDVRAVFNGAGASAIACAQHWLRLGLRRENLILCDSKGVVHEGREAGMNEWKRQLAAQTGARTLADALRDADVFCGCSVADCVTQAMVKSMAPDPVVFALANPNPEITYDLAKAARSDAIVATGRSDYPNQVNNVLGFPFIFRGALDVQARSINEEMKVAATRALADLAKEDVPDSVLRAYGGEHLRFGRDYIIPKPFDPRVLVWESHAVARAAMESGVARRPVDLDRYHEELEMRLGKGRAVIRAAVQRSAPSRPRIVLPEGEHEKILRAAATLVEEGICIPILVGRCGVVEQAAVEHAVSLEGMEIIDPESFDRAEDYAQALHRLRQRKGMTLPGARRLMEHSVELGAMMVHLGEADGLVSGVTRSYPETIRPALQIIGTAPGVRRVAAAYMMVVDGRVLFIADVAVNIAPDAETLAEIAILTAERARDFDVEPRIAVCSFSNFGSVRHPDAEAAARSVQIIRAKRPDLAVDGEMQTDVALNADKRRELFPFCTLEGSANVLVFSRLEGANAAYKILAALGGAEAIGPMLMGMRCPVHLLQPSCETADVVNMVSIASLDVRRHSLVRT
ncbi:MAG: NADP-dependent malic enzyme [Candidatus Sumerlaeia bacterium]|nr:NADP-dependent malic enzyme [Candidatus Sumerlaeia bacterium]